ncbi:MAG: UDP-glucose/GDP-mannose dehydrogenase dimerization [Parcubacteria group bacterium Greene0416_79]|nr:MAG: UDP-glucose/GDP-mannose dehydrogenase dimerization [Parcubacteria group bacterium Greene0416_79]
MIVLLYLRHYLLAARRRAYPYTDCQVKHGKFFKLQWVALTFLDREGEKGKKMHTRMKKQSRGRDKPRIGFIGQGFIGKNYADDFVRRGYEVVCYARNPKFAKNRERIQTCDIVFIAVPTPTTQKGFDFSIIREVLLLVGRGKTAVIKSTILPGTTETLQKAFPEIFLIHSPEFLREKHAAFDAAHPERNIIGIPRHTAAYRTKARAVMRTLPRAPYERVIPARAAELVKYGGNCFLYLKVLYANLLYDLAVCTGVNWAAVKEAVAADPRIGTSHMEPMHRSGHGGREGRGAGGHCLIKDFAAFSRLYEERLRDPFGKRVLEALADKNRDLLKKSGKDLELLAGVYGTEKL